MRKKIYCIIVLLILTIHASAQVSAQNYTCTSTMLDSVGKNYVDDVVYYDGLGRPFQRLQKAVDNNVVKSRLATLQEYDVLGRAANSWLPIVAGADYIEPSSFKSSAPGNYGNDSRPYSQPVYESSPLSRVIQQYGPGSAWWYGGHSVATEYLANTVATPLDCINYSASSTHALTKNGNYAAAELSVIKTTDEDSNISYTFTDKQGRTVLTRQMKGSETHDTYYVYDDLGNLHFVLQPMYQSSASLDLYAFQYKYDGFNRCVWKKLPGADYSEYVYDSADRLTFSQDGNQRNSGGLWTFYEYDNLNRLTRKGECTGKSVTSDSPVQVVNYYDTYPFISAAGFTDTRYSLTAEQRANGKGYATGRVFTVLDGSNAQKINVLYQYDIMGRVIKSVQNNLLSGFDVTETSYNFSGKVGMVKHTHTKSAGDLNPQTEVYTYMYDYADRLLTVTHKLNILSAVTIVNNVYNAYDQLTSNKRNGVAALSTSYAYNIRSWITSISGTTQVEELTYGYGGNIASKQWIRDGKSRKYGYAYDELSRLTSATYTGATSTEKYGTMYSYDKNGNILTLQRYGKTAASTYGIVDNLSLNYTGNQLTNVTDTGTTVTLPESNDFKKGSTATPSYKYDKNGNLTQDLNKKINGITYNSLSLPKSLTIDGVVHSYTYAADGTKLRVKQGSVERTYAGNFIYEGSSLKRILIDGGYIEGSTYYFYLNDHLGNASVVADASGTVVQRNDYYPFGLPMAETTATEQDKQPYKYNGKEFERKNGLNWMDYSARHYDATLGHFTTMDPLAEKYYSVSSYAYCMNNPVNRVDPTGMSSHYNWDTQRYEDEKGNEVSWNSVEREYGIGSAATPDDPPTGSEVDGVTGAAPVVNKFNLYTPVSVGPITGEPPFLPGFSSIKSAVSLWKILKTIFKSKNVVNQVILGNKLNFIFGKGTGSIHNIQRSQEMFRQLQRVGINNDTKGYLYLEQHLSEVFRTSAGVVMKDGRILRESLLMGPHGGLLVKSYWENNRLITVILLGGK